MKRDFKMTVFYANRFKCENCGKLPTVIGEKTSEQFCSSCGSAMKHLSSKIEGFGERTEQPVQQEETPVPQRPVKQEMRFKPVQSQEGEDPKIKITIDQRKNLIKSIAVSKEGFKDNRIKGLTCGGIPIPLKKIYNEILKEGEKN